MLIVNTILETTPDTAMDLGLKDMKVYLSQTVHKQYM